MMLGPVQLLTIGINEDTIPENIKKAFKKVHDNGDIRVLDALFVSKSMDGTIKTKIVSDLNPEQQTMLGAAIGALIGYAEEPTEEAIEEGAEIGSTISYAAQNYGLDQEDLQEILEDMPANSSALFMLVEHLWAKEVKKALQSSHVEFLAQGFLTPETVLDVEEEIEARAEEADKSPVFT